MKIVLGLATAISIGVLCGLWSARRPSPDPAIAASPESLQADTSSSSDGDSADGDRDATGLSRKSWSERLDDATGGPVAPIDTTETTTGSARRRIRSSDTLSFASAARRASSLHETSRRAEHLPEEEPVISLGARVAGVAPFVFQNRNANAGVAREADPGATAAEQRRILNDTGGPSWNPGDPEDMPPWRTAAIGSGDMIRGTLGAQAYMGLLLHNYYVSFSNALTRSTTGVTP